MPCWPRRARSCALQQRSASNHPNPRAERGCLRPLGPPHVAHGAAVGRQRGTFGSPCSRQHRTVRQFSHVVASAESEFVFLMRDNIARPIKMTARGSTRVRDRTVTDSDGSRMWVWLEGPTASSDSRKRRDNACYGCCRHRGCSRWTLPPV